MYVVSPMYKKTVDKKNDKIVTENIHNPYTGSPPLINTRTFYNVKTFSKSK